MGWVKKRILAVMLAVSLALPLAVSTPVEVHASQDYLSITLADIIIAWYNASGVAIGDTNVANAIYSAYSGITLGDLADHDCLVALDGIYSPGTAEMRAYVKELIGYGNLSVPMIYVSVPHLQYYLGELPASNLAKESLEAMFGWEGNLWNETMFGLLGGVIGSVANTGKLAYNVAANTLTDISDAIKNSYLGKTLLDIYRHFTNTTYFHDLLTEGGGGSSGGISELTLNFDSGGYAGIGFVGAPDGPGYAEGYGFCLRLNTHVFGYVVYGDRFEMGIYNNTSGSTVCQQAPGQVNLTTGEVNVTGSWKNFQIHANGYSPLSMASGTYGSGYIGGYAITGKSPDIGSSQSAWCRNNDPWDTPVVTPVPDHSGVTKYINNAVGNIASDNYINLSPNIGNEEYMYIFDRPTYIETLNQISNNYDNGDYIDNSTVINNYNNEYIQPPDSVEVRPSSAPAPSGQPVQPTVSPRPTQIPEEVSNIIYEGGISEEITKKFPFCIPWDIKAMIDRLWAPDRRAPYIHWDATFGSWGKLGEVDIDLSEFDNAAAIFRSTTLLLWIVGLVIITKHLIG